MALTIQSAALSSSVFSHGDALTLTLDLLPDSNVSALRADLYINDEHSVENAEPIQIRFRLCNALTAEETIPADGSVHRLTETFTVQRESIDPFYDSVLDQRALQPELLITYSDGSSSDLTLSPAISATLLNRWLQPKIELFSLERAVDGQPADDGLSVLTSLRISTQGGNYAPGFSLHLSGDAEADWSARAGDAFSGIYDDGEMLPGSFAADRAWNFSLLLSDGYEQTEARASLPAAFANLHLSGRAKGGACFGGFSTATDDQPKLESHYPAWFYAGIEGVTNYAAGDAATGGSWIDGKPVWRSVITGSLSVVGNRALAGALEAEPDTLLRMYGMVYARDMAIWRPINAGYHSGAAYQIGTLLSGKDVYLSVGSGITGVKDYCIITEYTRA